MGDLNTLVVHATYTDRLSYYDDWLDAFAEAPGFDVTSVDICRRGAEAAIRSAVAAADLTVLLHSTNGDTTAYLEPLAPLLTDRKGLLLSFVGNELNLPGSPISAKRAVFEQIRPEFIATQLLAEAGEYLFGDLVERAVVSVPHALNAAVFRPGKPHEARPIDVGVRVARYLPHLGDDDRNRIVDFFRTTTFQPPLKLDISADRLDRSDWAVFLGDSKGTVSTEAGSWYVERDDATVQAIRQYVDERMGKRGFMIANDSPLRTWGHKLPWGLRMIMRRVLSHGPLRHESTVNEELPFDEINELFFEGKPKPPVYAKCISSRHFEAIGTKTCQIMFPGRFNDILEAGEHYIALEPDFSNLDDVLALFRDPTARQRVVDRAYDHAMTAHTHAHRIQHIHDVVSER